MLYKVAVVEDDKRQVEILSSYFQKISLQENYAFELDCFESGESFMFNYKPIYHLILMDIGLSGINGMDTAIWLRKIDTDVTLVFITNMVQFAVRGYELNAFDFLVKPLTFDSFKLKIYRIIAHLNTRIGRQISISQGEDIYRISVNRIVYVEIRGHKITYHTTEGKLYSYGSLKTVEEEIASTSFCRCNSCYLVNLGYVQKVNSNSVIVNGIKLQMSRPKKKEFIQALNAYMGENI